MAKCWPISLSYAAAAGSANVHTRNDIDGDSAVPMMLMLLQFLSRPFVVGDRVELSTAAGAKFMVGYVERVDPMRTIFRTDACLPVMIPNKVGLLLSSICLWCPLRTMWYIKLDPASHLLWAPAVMMLSLACLNLPV